MAHSVDNFKDLEELGIDCDSSNSLTTNFNKAADHLKTLLPGVDHQVLLELYGYYKQATEGECNTPKPSWYDMKGKSKWEAWKKLEKMPQNEAKQLYIETITKLDPRFSVIDKSVSTESWVRVSVPKFEDNSNKSNYAFKDYVKEGNYEEVVNMLTNKSNANELLNILDEEGLSAIHWAADRGFVEILKLLINSGADVNIRDSEGQTPLHYASSCGHISCVRLLLSSGADLNILDNDGMSIQSVASDQNIIQLFLQK